MVAVRDASKIPALKELIKGCGCSPDILAGDEARAAAAAATAAAAPRAVPPPRSRLCSVLLPVSPVLQALALTPSLPPLPPQTPNPKPPNPRGGRQGAVEVARHPDAEAVVTGIVGCAGLLPTVAAIKAKKDICLANKETLIAGGPFVLPLAREYGVNILPADSEHSAIFQCIQARRFFGGVWREGGGLGVGRGFCGVCWRACRGRMSMVERQERASEGAAAPTPGSARSHPPTRPPTAPPKTNQTNARACRRTACGASF